MSKASKREAAIKRRNEESQRTQAITKIRLSYSTQETYEKLANGADPVLLLKILESKAALAAAKGE